MLSDEDENKVQQIIVDSIDEAGHKAREICEPSTFFAMYVELIIRALFSIVNNKEDIPILKKAVFELTTRIAEEYRKEK